MEKGGCLVWRRVMASSTPLEMTAWVVADDDNVWWGEPSAMSADLRARRYQWKIEIICGEPYPKYTSIK